MGKIKSALEIAMERTESVASDKSSIGQFEAKQKGKKLANEFLEGGVKSLEEEIRKLKGEEQASLKQGIFDMLISQITLPVVKDDMKRIEAAGRGLHAVIGGKRFADIARQMVGVLNQYLDEAEQYEEAIKRQYAPKLRQKEEEISRRIGRHVKLDPFQDPEFVAFYNQNMNTLKTNYEGAVAQVREEATRLYEGKD
jgi:polyhydroxyalkanoate synthesis regulator phasin